MFPVTRRRLLKVFGLSGALAAIPFNHLSPLSIATADADADVGEAYAGFLLLPAGTPSPSTIRPPKYGAPIVCGLGGQKATAHSSDFAHHSDAGKYAKLPLYSIANLPATLRPAGGSTIEYEWGEIFVASLSYQSFNATTGAWEGGVSVWVQTDFPDPYPFWYDASAAVGSPGWPEKVAFLPSPGLQVASGWGLDGQRLGYTYYWIKNKLLYWLRVENYPTESSAQALATSLTSLTSLN